MKCKAPTHNPNIITKAINLVRVVAEEMHASKLQRAPRAGFQHNLGVGFVSQMWSTGAAPMSLTSVIQG